LLPEQSARRQRIDSRNARRVDWQSSPETANKLLQSRAAMPLYEYQCTECEATLEAIQAFSAPPLEECPECGRSSLKKLLSAPAFQFKGSGWYVNDYARKGKNGSTEASSNGPEPPETRA